MSDDRIAQIRAKRERQQQALDEYRELISRWDTLTKEEQWAARHVEKQSMVRFDDDVDYLLAHITQLEAVAGAARAVVEVAYDLDMAVMGSTELVALEIKLGSLAGEG